MRFFDWLRPRPAVAHTQPAPKDPPEEESGPLGLDEDPFPAPVVLEIGDVFDLHAIADADCHAVTLEYLREAHARGYIYLRLIHGKGRGVRRRMVRELLSRTDFVLDFEDAPPAAGGTGATLVTLARTDSIGESS